MKKILFSMLCFANCSTVYAAYSGECATLQDVNDLPAMHWCAVPNSKAIAVEKKPNEWDDWNGTSSSKYNSYQRSMGFTALIENWNGGTFDTKRDRLVLFGGGHNGYGGNEIIAFDIATLSWSRLTDPTPYSNRDPSIKNNDGTPISRHTYGGLAYNENDDSLFVFGGAPDAANGGCGTKGTWTFDFSALELNGYQANQWSLRSSVNEPQSRCDDNAVYDPVTGKIYYHFGTSPSGWSSYDATLDKWEAKNTIGVNGGVRTIIPGNKRIIVEFGANQYAGYASWDLTSTNLTRSKITTTGDKAMESADDPGAAYDWIANKIVAWNGGTNVYALDLDANNWQKISSPATNQANPGPVTSTGGVFGRFQYSRTYNVYIYVDSVNKNVYLYRFASGTPIQKPTKPIGVKLIKNSL